MVGQWRIARVGGDGGAPVVLAGPPLPDLTVCCVMGGRIYKSERDEKGTAVDGKRHVIFGRALGGHRFYVCGKIKRDDKGRLFLVITAHRRE